MRRWLLLGVLCLALVAQGVFWLYTTEQEGFRYEAAKRNFHAGRDRGAYALSDAQKQYDRTVYAAIASTLGCLGLIAAALWFTRKSAT